MEGVNSNESESISRLGSSPSDDESHPLPGAPAVLKINTNITPATQASKLQEKMPDPSNFSCEGYEIHEETPERGGMPSAAATSAPAPLAARNPGFDIATQPLETQFNWIEKEFAAIEGRTMNARQYNFTTSFAFPTKNRYINVMANEETLCPPPRSPFATRSSSSSQSSRSTGQRLLDTLRGSPAAASESAAVCDDVSAFKTSSVTVSGKNVPLYFNGNLLDMGVEPVFVASQAPVLDCMEDFLNAIYNYEIPLILMLTEVEEAGFVKADRYWPADRASGLAGEIFGNMAVYKDLSDPYTVDAQHELIRRPFFIRPCNVPREKAHKVVMVQYVGWPDRGVPDSTESFEELLRIINAQASASKARDNNSNNSNTTSSSSSSSNGNGASAESVKPAVLVHCSAGIGRTGTLIGAYTAIKMMEEGRLSRDSISNILLTMRRARFGMVQRVEQYMFLYLIVLQHLGVDTAKFVARMQPRADAYNYRYVEARQAAMAARAARQQQQ